MVLADKASQKLKFKAPTNLDSWIIAYAGAIAFNDKIEQKMLLAALRVHVSIEKN